MSIIPDDTINQIKHLRHFSVENLRQSRRYLVKLKMEFTIDEMAFQEMDKHNPKEGKSFLKPLRDGHDMGLISDAGVPGIADPGEEIILAAHKEGFQIRPLVGPSSILLALMASGLNGERFQFHGYLPIKSPERTKKIKQLEELANKTKGCQMFIETPYRNRPLFEDILKACKDRTLLSIATDLTLPTEYIKTLPIAQWRKQIPELHKRPCIFILA